MVHQAFTYSTIGLAVVLLGLGTNAMTRPDVHLKSLELPVHTEPRLRALSHALMRIWGIRNVAFGSVLACIWATGDTNLVGKTIAVSIILPIMDGFVVRSLVGGGELQHWVFPPILAIVAAGLFGVFES